MTSNHNLLMYRNQEIVQHLTNWKRRRDEDIDKRNVRRSIR